MRSSSSSATRLCRAVGLHREPPPGRAWVDDLGSPVSDAGTLGRLDALRIPPAWTDVWASPDPAARVQATGVDSRGRTQYRYSTAAEQEAAEHKFGDLLLFGRSLPALRARVDQHLARPPADSATGSAAGRVKRATATAVRLIDRGLFRVGTERYARDNHTYGLTTLTADNVRVTGSTVDFTFVGKEHRPWHLAIDDAQAAVVVGELVDGAADGAPLFSVESHEGHEGHRGHDAHDGRYVVSSAVVNAYIHGETSAPATAKTFRTWGGTAAAATMTAGAVSPVPVRSRRPDLVAYDVAAYLLGNTRDIARRSYVHPLALEAGRAAAVVQAVERAARSTGGDVRAVVRDDLVVAALVDELGRLSGDRA
jgi:DNA topoisomerase-1